jgi:TolB-like protein/DNA-binding winged helix-turn-helix (wHTH) protein/Tfp pilus assembly protein PilF
MQTAPPNLYEFGDFQLDATKHLLRRLDGTPVPLTPRVFETLLYMVEHHNTVLDKERIMEAVWPDSIVEENNLAQAISKLRQVFGETPGSHTYIVTVPGRGYRFVAEIKERTVMAVTPKSQIPNPTQDAADTTATTEVADSPVPPLAVSDAQAALPAKTRALWAVAVSGIVILGVAALLFVRYRSVPASVRAPGSPAPAGALLSVPARISEKSIAVLPFDNLSEEKQNAYFAVGVQDEIMSNLARIADLKVISRTSANLYKSGNARNSREIGQQLGVAHLLEGNVERIGNRLRVNAQLIDARTDTHLWAQTYDRDVTDLFAVQTEIAQAIAMQLYAKISPVEKLAIERPPTADLTAFDLYLRAKELIDEVDLHPSRAKENAFKAVQLLDQAVARDPAFLLAHCRLAYEHDLIYFSSLDHTETRQALAETSVRAALRLQPDAGETHLAQATHFYWGYRDYDRAREELAKAQRALPNNAEIFHFLGLIAHRQGRWDEMIRNLERAVDLDPRNVNTLLELGEFYAILHKHRQAIAMFDRAAAVGPRSAAMRVYAALIRVELYADMMPLRTVLNTIEAEGPASAAEVAVISFELARRERDPAGAARALANLSSENYIRQADYRVPRAWHEGLLAKLRQDPPAAHAAFMAARAETEKVVLAQPQNVKPLSVLALIDAELGKKENAIREGRTACEMVPVSKDALDCARVITILASIYALTGEKELALEQLETVSKIPCGPFYGALRLDPEWDLLRGDPRFEKIVASLAPKGD